MSEREEFKQLPEVTTEPPKPETKATMLKKLVDEIKTTYGFDVEPKNNIQYKIERVKSHLDEHYKFRFNVISQNFEYHNGTTDEFHFFSNRDFQNIQTELKMNNYNIGKDVLKSLIESKFMSKDFDPFREYLFSLPIYDKSKDYFKIFLEQVYLANESERAEFITTFKKWFVAMVGSLVDDRLVNQHCFVLVGEQGKFKTTFLNNLVPKNLQLDYVYSSKFNFENKDHYKFLGTKILINLDELATLSRTDVGVLKTILTDDRIIVRLPYGAFDSHMWRKASFCGSTNNDQFLTDETGNRRFLVFKISDIVLDRSFDLGLLYAQAFAMYKEGFQHWFDRADISVISFRNDDFHDVSIEQDLIQQYMQKPSDEEIDATISMVKFDTSTAINIWLAGKSTRINVNESTKRRVGMVLKKLGYKQKSMRIENSIHPIKVWCVKYTSDGPSFITDTCNSTESESPI